jgi:hypothetical protein
MSLLVAPGRGFGGTGGFSRESVAAEPWQRAGGSWGRQGFPHAPEPEAEVAR